MSDYNYFINEFKNVDTSNDAEVSGKNVPDTITVPADSSDPLEPSIEVPVATSSDDFPDNHIKVVLGTLPPVKFFSDGNSLQVTTSDYANRQDMAVTGTRKSGDNNIMIIISEFLSNSWVVGEIEIEDLEDL